MSSSEDFLSLFSRNSKQSAFKLGTIPQDYTTGNPAIIFDGEGGASMRTYPHLSSYTPAAGDRVILALVGHGGIVLGKLT